MADISVSQDLISTRKRALTNCLALVIDNDFKF